MERMQRSLLGFLTIAVGASVPFHEVSASEIYMRPQCKQGYCSHEIIRDIAPARFLRDAILMRYQTAYAGKKCADGTDLESDACFKRPAPAGYSSFRVGYSLCSRTNPINATPTVDPKTNEPKYVVNYLNPAGTFAAYQTSSTVSYFAVCHGWEPKEFDDTFVKFVTANGYKPLAISNEQTIVNSESEALTTISNASSIGETPSIRMLVGKWFATNPRVCKGVAGQTEELFTYSPRKFIGYESACDINKVAVEKNRLRVSFTCYGEGMASKETELYEFVSSTEAKRTTFDGKRSYTFTMRRCP
jgi:hypothetical protein